MCTKKPLQACHCSEIRFFRFKKAPAGMPLLRNYIFRYKKAPAGMPLLRNAIFRYTKAPAGMLLPRNTIFYVQTSPCGHGTAQKCNCSGTKKPLRACCCSYIYFLGPKKPLRACHCSEMLLLRPVKAPAGMSLHKTFVLNKYFFEPEKAPAGMSLLRNAIFEARKSPCGHVTAQKCYF